MRKNPYPGRLIAFEGLDGSGQSTQASLLQEFFAEKGIEASITKEPTDTSAVAERIRSILDKEEASDPLELQRLFAQDRKEHLHSLIIPTLKKGEWVITDRYALTSFAFSEAGGLDLKEVERWHEELLVPDATFFLKVSPQTAELRLRLRQRKRTLFEVTERMEKNAEGFIKVIRDGYENVLVVDGEQSVEKVAEDVRSMVSEHFSL